MIRGAHQRAWFCDICSNWILFPEYPQTNFQIEYLYVVKWARKYSTMTFKYIASEFIMEFLFFCLLHIREVLDGRLFISASELTIIILIIEPTHNWPVYVSNIKIYSPLHLIRCFQFIHSFYFVLNSGKQKERSKKKIRKINK